MADELAVFGRSIPTPTPALRHTGARSTIPAARNSCPLSAKKSSFSCVLLESVGHRLHLDHKPTSRGLALAKTLLHPHIGAMSFMHSARIRSSELGMDKFDF